MCVLTREDNSATHTEIQDAQSNLGILLESFIPRKYYQYCEKLEEMEMSQRVELSVKCNTL